MAIILLLYAIVRAGKRLSQLLTDRIRVKLMMIIMRVIDYLN